MDNNQKQINNALSSVSSIYIGKDMLDNKIYLLQPQETSLTRIVMGKLKRQTNAPE